MNDSITIRGIVATDPRHLVTGNGLAITSLRLASPSRRWDRTIGNWTNGTTNWFTVTAFRSLATNLHKSVTKGDRVIVTGRLRVRNWEREGRSGMTVEIDADAVGHDLAYGRGTWMRVPRHTTDESAPPSDSPRPQEAEGLETADDREQDATDGDGDGEGETRPVSGDEPTETETVEGITVDERGVVHEHASIPPEPSAEEGTDMDSHIPEPGEAGTRPF
jgi:single-strand DNA-binding protein